MMKLYSLLQTNDLINGIGRHPRHYRKTVSPVELAFIEACPSPSWKLYSGWIPRKNNQRAARIGNGTRMGLALLKRLEAQGKAKRAQRP